MKLAHLILAHNHPQQLERLVNRLTHPDADIYIHLDKKTDYSAFNQIASVPGVQFVKNRVSVAWAEYSVVEATISGIKQITDSGVVYSHINLLSGNDYPLRNAEDIQRFYFSNPGKSFIWYDKIFPGWPDGQARIDGYYLGDYGFPGRYALGKLMTKLLPNRKMPGGMEAYGRAQWWTLTPEAALFCIHYLDTHPTVKRFLMQTWCMDEVVFQTVLCNSPMRDKLVNDNKRYVLLDPRCSPVTLTMEHAQQLAASGKFYARKFNAETDSAIFDFLDEFATKQIDQ